ncbi:YxlC family protein [Shouchella lonarensis]|uniref:YxlC-like protein n=1 Tax=Shouchella lonarensis TaxID=1464122 RepID=A0A1G6GPC3_9BACI|nr:YxlC family protein [Shouchella lonarensis]SDB83779.1 hypothetical protein SAMN05421737_101320 [Shouchella lonarensis]
MKTSNKNGCNDEEVIMRMKQGLYKVDEIHSVHVPHDVWFKQKVVTQQRALHEKYVRQLIFFLLVALCIVSVLMAMLYLEPASFIVLQGVALFVITGVVIFNRKRQVVKR